MLSSRLLTYDTGQRTYSHSCPLRHCNSPYRIRACACQHRLFHCIQRYYLCLDRGPFFVISVSFRAITIPSLHRRHRTSQQHSPKQPDRIRERENCVGPMEDSWNSGNSQQSVRLRVLNVRAVLQLLAELCSGYSTEHELVDTGDRLCRNLQRNILSSMGQEDLPRADHGGGAEIRARWPCMNKYSTTLFPRRQHTNSTCTFDLVL
jgi:hypothetical protein